MDYAQKPNKKPHPEDVENIFSIYTFWYTLRWFRRGFKRDLNDGDLPEVPSRMNAQKNCDLIEKEWKKQCSDGKKISFVKILWACFGWKYLGLGMMQLCAKTVIILVQPLALGRIVSFFDSSNTETTKEDAYKYAIILIGVNVANCFYTYNYQTTLAGLSVQVHTSLFCLVYRKILKLTPEIVSKMSVGKVLALYNKDLICFEIFTSFANEIWIGVLQTIVVCFVIYRRIGTPTLVGIGVFAIIMPLQIYLGKLISTLRRKTCEKCDSRFQTIKETLSAIRLIKMHTWENIFDSRIRKIRGFVFLMIQIVVVLDRMRGFIKNCRNKKTEEHQKVRNVQKLHPAGTTSFLMVREEMDFLYNNYRIKYILLVLGSTSSKIALYLLIMTYLWLGSNVSAETIYFISSSFDLLSLSLGELFPNGIVQVAELVASNKRVKEFLEADELPQSNCETASKNPGIALKNVSANFGNKPVLRNLNLKIETGLTVITGSQGSGKTFLLKTILREHSITSGNLTVHGNSSYASQEPWLFASTIRQNILFGATYDEKRYSEVLKACALGTDLAMYELGDATMVEDRGANLSKGQQVRINLARAVYRDADIYLLDDSLSSVDIHVRNSIWQHCINTFLRGKIVLLATSNPDIVKEATSVLVMNEGEIVDHCKCPDKNESHMENVSQQTISNSVVKQGSEISVDVDENTQLVCGNTVKTSQCEVQKTGRVPWTFYHRFINFGGGSFFLFLVLMVCVFAQIVSSYSEKLVSQWVNAEQVLLNYTNHSSPDLEYDQAVNNRNHLLKLYSIMTLMTSVLILARVFAVLAFAKRVSVGIHKQLFTGIINATMHFFDTKFMGNILNRFAEDMACVDEFLVFAIYNIFTNLLLLIGIITLIVGVNFVFLLPAAALLMVMILMQWLFIPTGRSLKRVEVGCRGPVMGYFNATIEGLTTIRALKAQPFLKEEFDRHQNLSASASYFMRCTRSAFGFCLEGLSILFTAKVIFTFLLWDNETLPGNVGLAISSAFMLNGCLRSVIQGCTDFENGMTTVQRMLDYADSEQENQQGLVVEKWPEEGEIVYRDVSLTYPKSQTPVLRNINFRIQSKEKIGIVGRTGAGKSSIIATLFRLYEVDGEIFIDGINIKTVSLPLLRSRITIIPQDPILLSGTIRDNIDPGSIHSDQTIWQAIQAVNLQTTVTSLHSQVSENGSNFSVGQRQLICLARAICLENKIIVLDEATANMDPETDRLIHDVIGNSFVDCTVITIAHKLLSVLNSDRVMVLDDGVVLEFDEPLVLLRNKQSKFYNMVEEAGLNADDRVQGEADFNRISYKKYL